MRFFRTFLSFFTIITTAIVFVISLNYMTSADFAVPKSIMLQILAASLVTSLVTALGFAIDFKKAWHAVTASIVHFILLCVIMVFLGVWFGWNELNAKGVLSMVISVGIVYALVFAISYILMKKEADELNRALKERNENKE